MVIDNLSTGDVSFFVLFCFLVVLCVFFFFFLWPLFILGSM